MSVHLAEGGATKQFFLDMFTRDISLEDCILDLIDNSIDSLIRSRAIDVSDAILSLHRKASKGVKLDGLPSIDVKISIDKFEISDTCGGISNEEAINEVFRFGHLNPIKGSQLGVYGIGLKRAIFKIGNNVDIVSKTEKEGFKASIDVSRWVKDRDNWKIPLAFTSGTKSSATTGTKINIDFLRPEIKLRIKSGTLERSLGKSIAQTYALFLDEFVRVRLNGQYVAPAYIPIGESDEVKAAKETFKDGRVEGTVVASIASKADRGGWNAVSAGWYVLCNARL